MSESILNALVHLFAIITNFTDTRVSSKAREIVHSYLKKQLSLSQASDYLEIFDAYLYKYDIDNRKVDSEKGRKRGALSSVRVLKICQHINENLQQREKFIVLLRLIEFVNEDGIITDSELDFISTVAQSFNVPENEFQQIKALITNSIDEIEEKDKVLIIDKTMVGSDSDGEWFEKFKPGSLKEAKHIYSENLDGRIIVLNITSNNLYFFAYFGRSILYLQGHNVIPATGYILEHGSIIRGPKISPLYYSDIVAKFLVSPTADKITYTADNIYYNFKNSKNGIKNFSFSEDSGNLIGIMGGSGVGKSTLLNLLSGKTKPDSGTITINGYDIHSDKEFLEGVIGFVPQDDLLIEELTVFQNLYYNAQLCFSNFTKKEIVKVVETILTDLDLDSIKHLKVGNPLDKSISGGQRKRLNIGLELIREPSILFVDEPTSGLSSTDSEMVMLLLRQQASKGKLVIVNIHQPSSDVFKLFDKLWVMDTYGYIIYTGNPIDAVVYFKSITGHVNADVSECPTCGNVNPEQILDIVEAKVVDEYGKFTKIRKRTAEDWFKLYQENEPKIKLIKDKEKLPGNFFKIPSLEMQFKIFLVRNIRSKLTNRQYILLILLETPILALILSYFTKYMVDGNYSFFENKNLAVFLFMSVVVAIFTGLSISAQEIIKDRHILERESFLNLSHFSYINSKIIVLFIMSAIQILLYVIIGSWILEIKGMFLSYWLILFTTAAFANLLGLNISASFNSVVNIYILIPFLLVPHILFGGALVNFDDLHERITSKEYVPVIGDIFVSRWAYEALAVEQYTNNKFEKNFYYLDKEKSRLQFQSSHLIPAILNKITECKSELDTSKTPEFENKIDLIRNELIKISKVPASQKIKKPDFALLDKNVSQADLDSASKYLMELRIIYRALTANATTRRDLKYEEIKKNIGIENMNKLQSEYSNKWLEDIVTNSLSDKLLFEYNGKFIQKRDPIFMKPVSNWGRAQFYSSEKQLFGKIFNTYWFNLTVIWLGSFIMYIALLQDWLRKIFTFIQKKKAIKKHKE
ncbi:MAG: ATP-binding cassette domain-containing protein [Bacteroidales bacterium]